MACSSEAVATSKTISPQVEVDSHDMNDPQDYPTVERDRFTPIIREPVSVSEKSTPVSPMDNAFFPGPEKWWKYQKECDSGASTPFSLNLEPENWWGCRRHSENDIIGIPPNIDRRRSLTPELSCGKPICEESKQSESEERSKSGSLMDVDEADKLVGIETSAVEIEKDGTTENNNNENQETGNQEIEHQDMIDSQDADVEVKDQSEDESEQATGGGTPLELSRNTATPDVEVKDQSVEESKQATEDDAPLDLELFSTAASDDLERITATEIISSDKDEPELDVAQEGAYNIEKKLESETPDNEVFIDDGQNGQHLEDTFTTDSSIAPVTLDTPLESAEQVGITETEPEGDGLQQAYPGVDNKSEPENEIGSDDISEPQDMSDDVKLSDECKYTGVSKEEIPENMDLPSKKMDDQSVSSIAADSQDVLQPLESKQEAQSLLTTGAVADNVTDTNNEQQPSQQQAENVVKHSFGNIPVISYTPSEAVVEEKIIEPVIEEASPEIQQSKSQLEQTRKVTKATKRSRQNVSKSTLSHKRGKRQLEEVPLGRTNSRQQDKQDLKSNSFNIFISFAVILLLLAYLAISSFLSVTFSYFSHDPAVVTEQPGRVEFLDHIEQLEESFPSQIPSLWKIIGNAVEDHLKDPSHLERPVVLLLAGLPNAQPTTDCLATKLGAMFDAIFHSTRHPTIINGILYQDDTADVAKEKVSDYLQSVFEGGSHCVIIHSMDHLPPCTAVLLFQSYFENVKTSSKDAAIIQTIQLKPSDVIGGDLETEKNYEDVAKDHVRRLLRQCEELSEDQQDGMWSKIAANVVVVLEEDESQISKVCN